MVERGSIKKKKKNSGWELSYLFLKYNGSSHLKVPCIWEFLKSRWNFWKIPRRGSAFCKVADWEPATLLKIKSSEGIFEEFCYNQKLFLVIVLKLRKVYGTIHLWRPHERGGGVLKSVMCLRILLFLNNRSIVHFCGWWG